LQNRYGVEVIEQQLKELQVAAKRSFSNIQLICLLEWANKDKREKWEAVKILVQNLSSSAAAE